MIIKQLFFTKIEFIIKFIIRFESRSTSANQSESVDKIFGRPVISLSYGKEFVGQSDG